MKVAQCKYNQAGVDITLIVYFDPKAFDFIIPAMLRDQEEDFIRLTCDSIAAALPLENVEKYFYIKRIFKSLDMNHLRILCTDGFLIDSALSIALSTLAYSSERVKLDEVDQLPARFKLNDDLVKSMNERLPQFEEEAKKNTPKEKVAPQKNTFRQDQPQTTEREFKTEKSLEVFSAITQAKKELKDLAESDIKTLKEKISKLQGVDAKNQKEMLTQKINEITPINEKFSAETEEIIKRIARKTGTLVLFKQQVINALYESAKQFHALVLPKMQDAPLHARKTLQADFNKKFSGIASMSEAGELSSLLDTQKNLENLSLEDLQEMISDDSKTTPGLLQKCNTSFTEESPELQIVMKQLAQLNKSLPTLFKDDPNYANKDMVQIKRIPAPRSFQFTFSESALHYKNMVDDFCKIQKENLMNLTNQYKKILQIQDLRNKPQPAPARIEPEKKSDDGISELKRRKKISDAILSLANKDHEISKNYKETAKQLYQFVAKNLDGSYKSLIEKVHATIENIQAEASNADAMMQKLADIKSQIDIQINHYLLHPTEKPDLTNLDQKLSSLEKKRSSLIATNKTLENANHKLAAYDRIITRILEIDLAATKSVLDKQHNDAKELLLHFIQQANQHPASSEALKKQVLEQYSKVDANTSAIEKIMAEITGMQNAIFSDMESQPELSTEKLESRFQAIAEKMQALSLALGTMDKNVSGLKKMSSA